MPPEAVRLSLADRATRGRSLQALLRRWAIRRRSADDEIRPPRETRFGGQPPRNGRRRRHKVVQGIGQLPSPGYKPSRTSSCRPAMSSWRLALLGTARPPQPLELRQRQPQVEWRSNAALEAIAHLLRPSVVSVTTSAHGKIELHACFGNREPGLGGLPGNRQAHPRSSQPGEACNTARPSLARLRAESDPRDRVSQEISTETPKLLETVVRTSILAARDREPDEVSLRAGSRSESGAHLRTSDPPRQCAPVPPPG